MGGVIQFVGGPKHGERMHLAEWNPVIEFALAPPMPVPKLKIEDYDKPSELKFVKVSYRLTQRSGTFLYEHF